MFNKKNILRHSVNVFGQPQIFSARESIPKWYKDTERVTGLEDNRILNIFPLRKSFKACFPFLDSFQTGYMIPLSVDIAVKQTEGGPSITYPEIFKKPIGLRQDDQNSKLPTPHGYSNLHFAWDTHVSFKIPKGYSALVTHPLNRFDLPFLTLSGIIDGEFTVPGGNLPVFFNNSFEGIIEAGTPIAQIILFKTENWSNSFDQSLNEEASVNNLKSGSSVIGWYKKNIWKKKSFS
jgi:hypothetical protein